MLFCEAVERGEYAHVGLMPSKRPLLGDNDNRVGEAAGAVMTGVSLGVFGGLTMGSIDKALTRLRKPRFILGEEDTGAQSHRRGISEKAIALAFGLCVSSIGW